MKEFVFNECNICVNPNKVEGQVKRYDWQIETAYTEGKWVFGFIFGTPTSGWAVEHQRSTARSMILNMMQSRQGQKRVFTSLRENRKVE